MVNLSRTSSDFIEFCGYNHILIGAHNTEYYEYLWSVAAATVLELLLINIRYDW